MGELLSFGRARVRRETAQAWLSKRDIAEYLGFSVRWVEKQVARGMPCRRMGGRLRFWLPDVERWLSNQEGSRGGLSAS